MSRGVEPPLVELFRSLWSGRAARRYGPYANERRLPLWVPLVALVSIVVLVLPLLRSAPPPVSLWRGNSMLTERENQPAPADQPTPAPVPPPQINGDARPVAQFDIAVDDGLYAGERAELDGDLHKALGYVSQRFGSGPSGAFKAVVSWDNGCGLHGIAYTEARSVQVFTCDSIARPRAVAIMAHEFVHQLAQDRYGPAHLSADMILLEGVATWGAGDYWLGGQPDFRSYVREQRRSGVFYPLATDYTTVDINGMNALYYQWASFVDYLIATYGRDKFDKLYVSGHSAPGSSDYAGVYGKGLDQLEQEWQGWLGQ